MPTADSSALWIAGGYDENYIFLASSEFIQENQTTPGPELPVPIHSHVLVNILSDITIQIGGFTSLDFVPDLIHQPKGKRNHPKFLSASQNIKDF